MCAAHRREIGHEQVGIVRSARRFKPSVAARSYCARVLGKRGRAGAHHDVGGWVRSVPSKMPSLMREKKRVELVHTPQLMSVDSTDFF